jgi:hypothetical protein
MLVNVDFLNEAHGRSSFAVACCDSIRALGIAGKFQALDSHGAAVIRKRRVIHGFTPIVPRRWRNS